MKKIYLLLFLILSSVVSFGANYAPASQNAFTGAATYCQNATPSALTFTYNTCSGTFLASGVACTIVWYYNPTNTVVISGSTVTVSTSTGFTCASNPLGGVTTGSRTFTPSTATAGTFYYFCVIRWSAASCNGANILTSGTQLVTVNSIPTGVTATASTLAACTGTTFTLTGTASGATSYTWNGSGGYTDANLVTPGFFPLTSYSGIFTLTATAPSGCQVKATTGSVVVTTTPTVSISPSSSNYCTGAPGIALTAGTATNYVWTPNPGNLTAYTGANVTATPTITTTYSVVGTNASCTSNTGTATITVIGAAPTITASGGSAFVCTGGPISTTRTMSGGTSYTWSPTTGVSPSSGAGPTFTITPTSSQVYTITGISGSCSNITTTSITRNTSPTVTTTPSSALNCSGGGTTTTAATATTYAWSPSTGVSNTAIANPTFTPLINTIYTVTGTTAGCSTDATFAVTIGTTPTFTMSPVSSSVGCPGAGVSITATSGTSPTYVWSPITALSATTGASVTASPTVTTTYTITASDVVGCRATHTSAVNVISAVVSAPTASSITTTSVHLTWSAVTGATGYTMRAYTNSGLSTLATSATTTLTSGDLTTLSPNTAYYITIASNIGPGCDAPNSPYVQVNTPVGFPYWESFENISTQNTVPTNWQATANAGSSTPKYADNNTSGTAPFHGNWDFIFVGNNLGNTNANNWLVSPALPMVSGTTYNVSFNYNILAGITSICNLGSPGTGQFFVYISNNGTLPAASATAMSGTPTTLLSTSATQGTGWVTPTTMTFTPSSTGSYYLGIRYVASSTCSFFGTNYNSPNAQIDNVRICSQPSPSATSVSASPNPVCQSANLALSATIPTGYGYYNWAGPNSFASSVVGSAGTATVSAIPTSGAGIYTVTVVSDPYYTCTSSATTASVTVIPIPAAIAPSDTVICSGASYTLRGNPASATAWSSAPLGNVTISSGGVVTGIGVSGVASPVTITYNTGCGTPTTATVKTVNSLGGTYTVGNGQQFPTLTDAVAIYNCATSLTGPVVFQLMDASYPNETYPITINNNSAASTTNTLTIRPGSSVSPTISGSSTGAIIAINGKYVTIDGSNSPVANSVCPSTSASRDLTITNTNAGTSSAVIWMGSGANNDTVRNCVITGSGAAQTLVGVGSGGASIALNSVGSANNNNAVINNAVSAVQNGVYSMGASAGAKNTGTAINLNAITAVSNNGIMVGFESGINVRGNTITNVTSSVANTDVVGINVGFANNSIISGTTSVTGNEVSDALIENNVIGSITSSAAAGTQSAAGIAVAGTATGTSNTIVNNAVYNVLSRSGTSDITAGIFLSGITSGIVDYVWQNTVDLTNSAGGGTNPTYALGISGVASSMDIRNNILVNTSTNGTANSARALGMSYSTYGSLISDYNNLNATGSTSLVSVGSLSAPVTTYPSVAAWQTGSGSTEDAHSINVTPTFNNPSSTIPDLGLAYAAGGNVSINNAGTPLSYTTDANCATRDAAHPDLGINEYNGSAPPPTIALTTFPSGTANCPVNKTVIANITIAGGAPADLETGTNKPRIYFSKDNIIWYSSAGAFVSGTTTVGGTSSWTFTIDATTLGLVGNETVYYYVVAQDQSSPAGVGSFPSGVIAVDVNSITAAPTPSSYGTTISQGTYYVGTGQDFSTLPLAVAAYNATGCMTGPIVFKLTDATYSLAAPLAINTNALASSTNTLTIMPNTGVSPNITCSATTATISLTASAKYIIIDGSNNPVTNSVCPLVTSSRNMTITNTNTGTSSAVVWLGSGANNNIVRNCNITGNAITTTLIGIGSGGAAISVTSTGSGNNNNRIENNSVSLVQHGIFTMGASSGSKNSGTVINQNLMTATAGIGKNGILAFYENNITISGNSIKNINQSGALDVMGISLGIGDNGTSNSVAAATYEVTNATVTNNKIDNITNSNTTGYSATGIMVGGAASGTNTIANNMVSGVWSVPTSPDLYAGIYIGGAAGSTTNLYYNAVYLSGGNSGGTLPGFGVAVSGSNPTINIKNNIIVNNSSSGSARCALGFAYATYSGLTSNSNDIYATSGNLVGYNSISAPSYYTSISAWNVASGKDAPVGFPAVTLPIATVRGSTSVLPTFTSTASPVDLSLTTSASNYLLNNTGTSVSPAVTSDFACTTRDATYPDIGVNEFTPTGCSSTVAGTVAASTAAYCVTGSPTISLTGHSTGSGAYYQWQSSPNGVSSWASISGATNATYTPTVSTTTYYRSLVACLNVSPIEQTQSSVASVTIAAQPSVSSLTLAPSGTLICSGASITLTGVTAGGVGTPTYTWTGPGISSTTGSSLTSPVLNPTATATGAYSMIVSYDGANCVTSSPRATASVYTISPQAVVTGLSLLPANTSICSGANITLTAATSGGAGTATYTWSGPGLSGTTGASSVSPVLHPTVGSTASGAYSVTLGYSGTGCTTTVPFPTASTYTVAPQPAVTSITPSLAAVCEGSSLTLTGAVTGGAGSVVYTWSGAAIATTTGSSNVSPAFTPTIVGTSVYSLAVAYSGNGCNVANGSVSAAVIIMQWGGGTMGAPTDWNTSSNWSCGFVPSVTNDVTIPVTGSVPEILSSSSGTARNLTLLSGASVTVNSGSTLNVKGKLSNNGTVSGTGSLILNGTSAQTITGFGAVNNLELNNSTGATVNSGSLMTIKNALTLTSGTLATGDSVVLASSDTFESARVAPIVPGAAITGKVQVRQFIQGGYRRFRFLSHPFSSAISLSQLQPYIDITGAHGSDSGFTTTASNAPSAFRYDPQAGNSSLTYDPGWKAFTSITAAAADTNTFNTYQGIRVFMRGSKGEGLGYETYIPASTTISMAGYINQGNQTVTLTKGAGAYQEYNMLGNPYPSPVNIGAVAHDALVAGQITGSAFYVWNQSIGASGNYQAIPINTVSATPYYLQANQAFQVRADHNLATLSFTESNKAANATNYLFKAQPETVSLSVYDVNYHLWDMLHIRFTDEGTDGEDKYLDATKPSGADFNFYSLSSDNKKMVIDARPYDAEKVVPLGVSSAYQQQYIIKAESVFIPDGGRVYLHDKLLQQYVLLDPGTEYRFTISKDKATQGDGRFELSMKPSTALATATGLQVTMTPNPATDEVKISFSAGKEDNVSLSVLDMSGVNVYEEDLGVQLKGSVNVPLSKLASGVYMVELRSGNQKVIQRLVKE